MFLLDTNVIAEIRKGSRADANVTAWYGPLNPEALYLSVLTVGEIRKGIENVRRNDRNTANALDRWLRGLVKDYGDRILAVDLEVVEEWGRLNAPNPLPAVDGLIAATAKVHGLTLATRNVQDIVRTGVPFVNPFGE